MLSGVIWFNGIWMILDHHIIENYWERNVVCLPCDRTATPPLLPQVPAAAPLSGRLCLTMHRCASPPVSGLHSYRGAAPVLGRLDVGLSRLPAASAPLGSRSVRRRMESVR